MCSCLALFGCSEDQPGAPAPSDADVCAHVNVELAACGLKPNPCKTSHDACYARCQIEWRCSDLSVPSGDPGISACLWNCSPRFTCDDGAEIHDTFRCDGVGDCVDAEDERGCPPKPPPPGPTTTAATVSATIDPVPDALVGPDNGLLPAPPTVVDVVPPDAATPPDAAATSDAATPPDAATDVVNATGSAVSSDGGVEITATVDASLSDIELDAGSSR